MKLEYYKGNNFGDALNPLIFSHFLPGYFDKDDEVVFLGIGSILGLKKSGKKKIVFSTGYAAGSPSTYGLPPKIDSSYDIICVRGPLTTSILNIDSNLAVTDGAILLAALQHQKYPKVHEYSYIPHVGSEDFFDWRYVCDEVGINYISPREPVEDVIKKSLQSKVIIAEAMHGAILADTLRIPWIPVKCYGTINEFKWKDWAFSLGLTYEPNVIHSLYKRDILRMIMSEKVPVQSRLLSNTATVLYEKYQDVVLLSKVVRSFKELTRKKIFLSEESNFNSKFNIMIEKLEEFKYKYPLS